MQRQFRNLGGRVLRKSKSGDHVVTALIARFVRDRSAASAVEYGLVATLIAAFVIVVIGAVGLSINGVFVGLADVISSVPGSR
jgi:pilus assembly protein Flp/PilA